MAFDTEQLAYTKLRDVVAERTTPLVAWIGAGLSVSAGLPTWAGLRTALVEVLRRKAGSLEATEERRLLAQATAVEEQDDYWLAFELLESALGKTTYRESIRSQLSAGDRVAVPQAYLNLWKLRPAGIINLNLDRLATRARAREGAAPPEFSGFQLGAATNALNGRRPYIINIHGTLDDTSSWIFTRSQLTALMARSDYKTFVRSCLATQTVLFLGVTADDLAVGGHLDWLAQNQTECGPHFWLTNRTDGATDAWAERAGVMTIRYDSSHGHGAVDEFFADLLTFCPEEQAAVPVAPTRADPDASLPSPAELVTKDAETIRRVLNARACALLRDSTQEAYDAYERFSREYDEAQHRAWYVSANSGPVLGYALDELVNESGAFGKVYRATSSDGEAVAVKILHVDARNKPGYLQCFRRGVRSMSILAKHSVKGMVAYKEAFEIPAMVVMDWIDGASLREAVASQQLGSWDRLLPVCAELARIVRSAHTLPERVLHRDLRPSNVMLEHLYAAQDDPPKVRVLDFDLSWHEDAAERSVIQGSSATGYLAPEQLRRTKGVSTRNAAVDSFGLGMTLYYVVAKRDPAPAQHQHASWVSDVQEACRSLSPSEWKSISKRFARLILNTTAQKQSERWDMAQVEAELVALRDAENGIVVRTDLITEELAARTVQGYEWDEDRAAATARFPSGIEVRYEARAPQQQIALCISWADDGNRERKKIGKWLPDATRRAAAALEKRGWRIETRNAGAQHVRLIATQTTHGMCERVEQTGQGICAAIDELRFD